VGLRERAGAAAPAITDGRACRVYDQFGATAFALCVAITGDRQRSADIVVECCRSSPPEAERDGGTWLLQSARSEAVRSASADSQGYPPDWLDTAGALNDQQRRILGLVYLGGVPVNDVALRMGITPHEAASTLGDAMARLRESRLNRRSRLRETFTI